MTASVRSCATTLDALSDVSTLVSGRMLTPMSTRTRYALRVHPRHSYLRAGPRALSVGCSDGGEGGDAHTKFCADVERGKHDCQGRVDLVLAVVV